MIGIILSGHGQFATGLYSSIKLIAGQQENFEAIDFEEGMSADVLSGKISDAIDKISSMDHIVILTDIPGGTPFNESAKLSATKENVTVLAGVSAPVLLDSCFKRSLPVDQFIKEIVQSGKDAMKVFKVKGK